MDRIQKKKKKIGGEKKVLLSIVNPWDVTVASVNPVGLAARRGVSLSTLPSSRDEGVSQEWPTLNRPVKVPSPWYKPGSGSSGHVNSAKSEEAVLIDSTWLNLGYSPQRSPINVTYDTKSPNPSKERLQDSKQKTDEARRDVEAGEVDNGLINGSQEISRDGFDDVDSAAAVRVRFEIGKAQDGVRCENGQGINSVPRVLPKSQSVNDNSKFERERRVIAKQNRANGETVAKRKSSRETDDVKFGENTTNTNDKRNNADSRIVGETPAVVDIVKNLVESRYNPQSASERRISRMPSCRQEIPIKVKPMGKTTVLKYIFDERCDVQ